MPSQGLSSGVQPGGKLEKASRDPQREAFASLQRLRRAPGSQAYASPLRDRALQRDRAPQPSLAKMCRYLKLRMRLAI